MEQQIQNICGLHGARKLHCDKKKSIVIKKLHGDCKTTKLQNYMAIPNYIAIKKLHGDCKTT